MRVGLDIGSTTIKCAVLDEHDALIYSTYERHYSHILEKAQELLRRIDAEHLHGNKALLSISGDQRHRGPHERQLCRRHRCLY